MFLHHESEGIANWVTDWKFEPVAVAPVFMLFLAVLAVGIDPDAVSASFAALVVTSPVWLPVVLFIMFWKRWMHYIRFQWWFSQEMTLLHVELPPEVEKSPLAMELVLVGLWNNGSETTFLQRIWKGQYRAITTLELVANGPRIGWYIHLKKTWKNFIEARIYGQYPEARVTEVKDYVDDVPYSPETHDLWGTEYTKSSSVAEAAPIKTYTDWNLDKNPDTPEIQTDPLTNILEFMSTIKEGEHLWVQIVMKARKKDEWYGFYGGDHYKDEGEEQIKKITEGAIARAQSIIENPEAKTRAAERGTTMLTEGERGAVTAIQRSLGKQVFDCGIRGVYICKKGMFDLTRVNNLVRLWDPFRSEGWQALNVTRGNSIFDYPWQDWREIRRTLVRRRMFFWYKNRAYFYVPYDQVPVCMTTEELASIWHFPSSAVKTPGLVRVPSRVAEAPSNLPTAPSNLPT